MKSWLFPCVVVLLGLILLPMSTGLGFAPPPGPSLKGVDSMVVQDQFPIEVSSIEDTTGISLATNLYNGEVLVVYELDEDIYGHRLDPDGNKVGTRFRISRGGSLASNPDVAFEASTGQFVVAWEYDSPVTNTVDWTVIVVHGVHNPSGSQLASGPSDFGSPAYDELIPAVACNREAASCLVAGTRFTTRGMVIGQRFNISPSNISQDGDAIEICDATYHNINVDIAFGGVTGYPAYLVAWARQMNNPDATLHAIYTHVHGAEQGLGIDELIHAPAYITPPGTAPSHANDQMFPSVAYNPIHQQFLIAYQYDYTGDMSDYDLYGQHVQGYWSGLVGSYFPIASSYFSEFNPAVAFSGGETPGQSLDFTDQYLVTYIRYDAVNQTYALVIQSVHGANAETEGIPQILADVDLSANYLFLESKVSGSYYNGRWMIVLDRMYDFSGTQDSDLFGFVISSDLKVYLPIVIR